MLVSSEQVRFENTSEAVCIDCWVTDEIWKEFQTLGPATEKARWLLSVETCKEQNKHLLDKTHLTLLSL